VADGARINAVARYAKYSSEQKLLARQLSTPVNGLRPVLEVADEHIEYQRVLEQRGIMVIAGPSPPPANGIGKATGLSCTPLRASGRVDNRRRGSHAS
jgi:hypothetical protein